ASTLILPSQQIHAFRLSETDIYNCDADKYAQRGTVEPGEVPADAIHAVEETEAWPADMGEADVALAAAQGKPSVIVHKVASGESLYSIAEKYGVTASEIKKSNNLRRNAVRVGQQLRITTTMPGDAASSLAESAPVRQQSSSGSSGRKSSKSQSSKSGSQSSKSAVANPSTHKIKNGETLSSISKKYGISVAALKAANGMSSDALRAGASLKIPAKSKSASASSSSSKRSGGASASKKSTGTKKSSGTRKSSSKKRKRR
ncbi:MAG: LysM peptidoglycan-binding domain-containing protein, partial [Muribaculaceae bacterium]|nr:LysM peptidoglycan-binding domain-containing protein [Muribaculaceae bacterium]